MNMLEKPDILESAVRHAAAWAKQEWQDGVRSAFGRKRIPYDPAPTWEDLEEIVAWVDVEIPHASYRVPDKCPDCLSPAPDKPLRIRTQSGKLTGWYLVACKHEYLDVTLPFCRSCADRLLRWSKYAQWLIWGGVVFDVAIGLWFNLGRTVGFLILIPFLVPAAWLSFFRDRVVEIAQYDEETIVLSFKRPGYAREFLQVNQGKASLIGLRTSIGSFASPSELADLTQRLTAEAHAHA
jgi:hypothetical protein